MPKVSDEYREARRDEIARAALRCLERNGVRDTSIADIVAESGLSTGAIYSHFSNKAELARYIVGRFLLPRIDALETSGERGDVVTPRQALRGMLGVFEEVGLPPSLVLQFWGEAMVEPGLHEEMLRTAGRLRASLAAALGPWSLEQAADPTDAEGLAAGTARTVAALAQGYVANVAVFGPRDIDEYLDTAETVLAG
ncbi:TetR/AcrR family transcriptional regulator [Microbacterium sp. M3]|uniref:TetR/AcrR family transcriptional regulator n=1 Tax=Microbacterium arthrosphaerae TaxID=792652 RepID=A0ABU4H362_9MICO|nr:MULTISPECIES: TetR/AcrR family transcriptional regulator [Microbacterium]MDW4573773.1 TetR/AcrR family transcriptional regulator [Microbacterium arthrosphaerae]MDW7607628.1 TetR/AcrR family transcriptional regulator [Microbacterium sp. M3]